LTHGYRVVAHDRRSHGRSTQTDSGNEMDTYAADVSALVSALTLKKVVHVGHSTGGGEVAHYVARADAGRVSKAVLIGAVPPIMLRTEANPGGLPLDVFDGFREALLANRAQFTEMYLRDRSMDSTAPALRSTRGSSTIGGGKE
jgi:non-heme chloroperoxidase